MARTRYMGKHRIARTHSPRVMTRRACLAALSTAASLLVPVTYPAAARAEVVRPDPPTVTMKCTAGQFDINTPDATSVSRSLDIDPAVAERWVKSGPWLRPADLLTVAGVGPGWLASMTSAGRLCALPPSTPPPTFDVCTGSRVDVQTAGAQTLRKTFGLDANTAINLIDARPYQALRQIRPERVPGLGTSSQKALVSKGCLTPASIVTAARSWRWAYNDTTTTAHRAGFALKVPAGTITASPGAWLSVADAEAPTLLAGPTADFHIWGAWAPHASSAVTVTLPVDRLPFTPTETWVDGVVHYTPNGPVFAGPGATTVADGKVTLAVTSLSLFTAFKAVTTFFTAVGKAVFTAVDWVDATIRWYLGLRASRPECSPDITGDPLISTSGSALESVDLLNSPNSIPIKYCVEQAQTGVGEWKLANNLGTVVRLYSPAAPIVQRDVTGDALTDNLFWDKGFSASEIMLPPGGSARVRVNQGSPTAELSVSLADTASVMQAFVARSLGRVIPKFSDIYGVLNDCSYALLVEFGDIAPLLKCAITGLLVTAEEVSKILAPLSVAFDIVINDVDALQIGLSPRDLQLKYFAPPSAKQPADGNVGGDPAPPAQGEMRIIKRVNSNASYLVDSSGVAYPIPDGGTYTCLAYYWPVRYNVSDSRFAAMVTSIGLEASCPPPVGEVRQLTRWNTVGFILRGSDGSSFLVGSDGYRLPILSGDDFYCFTQSHDVWDWVTPSDMAAIPRANAVAVFCNEPSPIQGGV